MACKLLKEKSPTEVADFFDHVQMQWFKRVLPEQWVVSHLDWRTNNFTDVNCHHLLEDNVNDLLLRLAQEVQ